MDDSILNSWTTESDIPSVENVSHIGRDYTAEFTTDQASICYFLFYHTIIILLCYQCIKSIYNNVVLMYIFYLLTDF